MDTQTLLLLAPLILLGVGLEIAAVVDLLRGERAVRGGNKAVWLLVILLVSTWGALIYFLWGREDRPAADAESSALSPTPPPVIPTSLTPTLSQRERELDPSAPSDTPALTPALSQGERELEPSATADTPSLTPALSQRERELDPVTPADTPPPLTPPALTPALSQREREISSTSTPAIRNPQSTIRNSYEAIRMEGLGKDFGGVRALAGLDLTVMGPGVFGFLGPNGAGKSTTIRLLTGLSRPSRGRAWIAGRAVQLETQATAPLCGYLAEDPQFYPWMTGRELLIFVGQVFGLDGAGLGRRADELLALVGLSGAGGRRLGGYSRGMRQRLGIAHALVHDPPVLILDEPVSALDPVGRREVLALIARLGQDHTVFMSTHILADVERVCDNVAVLDRGRLIATARTEELRERYAQPVFEIEFAQAVPGFADQLRGLAWVAGVEEQGTLLRVVVREVGTARTALLPLVAATGVAVLRYEQVLPSLEDVFVRLVGA